jgi:hypothetical protein
MADSLKTIDAIKAQIRSQAEEKLEKLDRLAQLAEEFSMDLVSKDGQSKNDNEVSDQSAGTSATAPLPGIIDGVKVYASGYVRHKKPWTDTIIDILKKANRGLTKAELKAEVEKTHLAARLQETETGFYGAISKLKTRKKLIEHNGRLYTPKAFAQFQQDVEAGLVKDSPTSSKGTISLEMKKSITKYLTAIPQARAAQIIKMLETNNKMGSSTGTVYNVLSEMINNGILKKNSEGCYSLNNKDEASTGEPEDASVNGRGATLSNESYESGIRRTQHS